MIQFFGYNKCSTCQKAKKFLKQHDLDFKDIDITQNPPAKSVLKKILKSDHYSLKHLLNTSGVAYREMDMKSKRDQLSEDQLLQLLSQNGRLVKRPIIIEGDKVTVGYKEERIQDVWG